MKVKAHKFSLSSLLLLFIQSSVEMFQSTRMFALVNLDLTRRKVSTMSKVVLKTQTEAEDMSAMPDTAQICRFDWTGHTALTFGKDN